MEIGPSQKQVASGMEVPGGTFSGFWPANATLQAAATAAAAQVTIRIRPPAFSIERR